MRRFNERFYEREEFLKTIRGKEVRWRGRVMNVYELDSGGIGMALEAQPELTHFSKGSVSRCSRISARLRWKSYEMVLRYAHLAPVKLSFVASRHRAPSSWGRRAGGERERSARCYVSVTFAPVRRP